MPHVTRDTVYKRIQKQKSFAFNRQRLRMTLGPPTPHLRRVHIYFYKEFSKNFFRVQYKFFTYLHSIVVHIPPLHVAYFQHDDITS